MSGERQYEVKTRERDAGGWMYQLFAIGADDPLAWESDGKSYRTSRMPSGPVTWLWLPGFGGIAGKAGRDNSNG
jgi:hypothetical protein